MSTALETALTALATLQNAAAGSTLPGLTSGRCYEQPPASIAPPCIVNVWTESEYSEFPSGEVPTGRQYEHATVEMRIYSTSPDMARAQAFLVPVVDGLRSLINGNKTLTSTIQEARIENARAEKVEYNGVEYHGATVAITLRLDLAGGFAS